jgi:hypothetical protein
MYNFIYCFIFLYECESSFVSLQGEHCSTSLILVHTASEVFIQYFCHVTVTHACRKRRLKWVATLPLGDINTEAWSSGMGVGRGANNPTL